MHGCPSRLGPYLQVECMNQSKTNFSRTAQSQRGWQGAIWHIWTSKCDKHWRHSHKERLAYKLVDWPLLTILTYYDDNWILMIFHLDFLLHLCHLLEDGAPLPKLGSFAVAIHFQLFSNLIFPYLIIEPCNFLCFFLVIMPLAQCNSKQI